VKFDQTNNIIQFAVAYLLSFTCLYVYFYFDIRGFLIVLMLLSFISLPSLSAIFILYFLSIKKKFIVGKVFYILLSILLFIPSFLTFDKLSYDPRNIFPIFEESKYIIYLLCLGANLFAIGYLELLKKIRTKNGVEHRV
jgi:hypothetical protein